jgi:hypothetical protein
VCDVVPRRVSMEARAVVIVNMWLLIVRGASILVSGEHVLFVACANVFSLSDNL